MKKFFEKNKKKLIIGGLVVGGIVLPILAFACGKKSGHTATIILKNLDAIDNLKTPDINFGFNDLGEAITKFQELSAAAPDGTISLWNKGMEGFEYLVQDLS